MHLRITSDANTESGVGKVVDEISGPTRKQFVAKNYGGDFLGIGVVLMCRDPGLNFKRRVSFLKKDKKLYMDVMLDLDEMKSLTHEERRRIISERLANEIPGTISKYNILDFNKEQFVSDLRAWLDIFG